MNQGGLEANFIGRDEFKSFQCQSRCLLLRYSMASPGILMVFGWRNDTLSFLTHFDVTLPPTPANSTPEKLFFCVHWRALACVA